MKRSGFGVVLAATAVTILAGAPPDASLAAGSVSRLSGSVPASANEFVTNRRADWFRYAGPGGQDVRAQIQMESGPWSPRR